jgi:hypothetical protein
MTAKKALMRRAVGAGLAVVLSLVVVGSGAAARDRTPPTTPTNLHVTSVSQTSVTLAWNPATSSPGVESFIDSLNPAGSGTLLISATSGFSNCSSAP